MTTAPTNSRAAVQPLGRGSSLNLMGSVAVAASNVLLLVVVTRSLGAGGAGAFLEAVAFVSILLTVGTLGADTGLIRVLARPEVRTAAQVRQALGIALVPVTIVATGLGVAVWSAAGPIAAAVGDATHAAAIADHLRAMAPFVVPAALMMALLGATRGLQTMTPTVVLDRIARPVLQIAACGAVVALGGGASALGLAWAAPYAVGLAGAIGWGARLVSGRWMAGEGPDGAAGPECRGAAVDFWGFAAPRALASGMQILLQWLDVLLVGALTSTREAGIYAVASRLIQLGFYVVNAVGQAVQPRLARLFAAEDRVAVQSLYQRSTIWTVLLVWPVFIVGALAAPTLLDLFGPEFAAGAAAVAILALSGLLSSGVGSVDMVVLMAGRSSVNLAITAVALVGNVGLNLLLIPRMGITGAAVAWAASRVIAKLLALHHVRTHIGVHPFSWDLGRVAGLATACFGAGGLLALSFDMTLTGTAACVFAACAVYAHLLRDRVADVRRTLARTPATPSTRP